MITLILIVQTYTGAMAYEFGPYPDKKTCHSFAQKHIEQIERENSVLKIAADCRLLTPELGELAAHDD